MNMNKLLSIILASALALSAAAPVFAAPAEPSETDLENAEPLSDYVTGGSTGKSSVSFSDINTEDFAWAKPYITSMASQGYISGYEDGTYRPDNDVTRQECISLFARAMGSNDEANAEILEIAHDKYDAIIKNYSLTWGQDEIVYMMYKGALKKTDLDTYLKGQEKTTPMSRYEAAIIITKALGGEDDALSDMGVVLDYTDAREVPSNAIQYVSYATEQGIMTGMGDGTFSPTTPVKRSQTAVMLSKTVDKTDYTFEEVKLDDVDTSAKTITVTDSKGKEKEYAYTDNTKFRSMGDNAQPLTVGKTVDAVLTLSGKNLVSVDAVSDIPDQTVSGKYISYATTSGKTNIRITVDETGEAESFELASDVSVTYDGSPATVRSFTKGDVLTLKLQNGKVKQIIGDNQKITISGAIVTSVDLGDGVTITISHSDDEYNGKTYEVSSDVAVKKNDATVGLDSIYPGDKVKLELQYNKVTKITATSTTKTVEGTIRSLTIGSPDSTMTVYVKGEEKTYTIPKDVTITINGSEGSLYDFRIGDIVKITTESDAITKIVATSTQESSGNVTGVVTGVNTSYGVVTVKVDGSEIPVNVFCKDDSTTFVSADGKTKKMKDVQVGQTVEIKGTVSNGVFVGKLFVIVAEAN